MASNTGTPGSHMARCIGHATINSVERHAHRTSIWVNTNEGWRLRFHQGTPLP